MIFDGAGDRAYADTFTGLVAALIPGYEDVTDNQEADLRRLLAAVHIQVTLQAELNQTPAFAACRPEACSGSNSDCGYCGCPHPTTTATTAGGVGLGCGACPVRCGNRSDLTAWMADIGGTVSFDGLDLADLELPVLPRVIPQVDGVQLGELDRVLRWPAYAVGLRRVLSPRTGRMAPSFTGRTAADVLGLDAGRAAVLVGYGKDPLVEALWSRRASVIAELADQNWDLVLAPNFSVYGDLPRTEMLINFRRNLLIATASGTTPWRRTQPHNDQRKTFQVLSASLLIALADRYVW